MATFKRVREAALGATMLFAASGIDQAQGSVPYAAPGTMQTISESAPKQKMPDFNSVIGKSTPQNMQDRSLGSETPDLQQLLDQPSPEFQSPVLTPDQEQERFDNQMKMLDALLAGSSPKSSGSGFQNAGSDGPQGSKLSELFAQQMTESMKEKAGPAPAHEEAPSMGRYGGPSAVPQADGIMGSQQGRMYDADSLSGKFQGPAQGMMGSVGPKAPMQGQMGYGVSRPKAPGLGL